MFLHQEDGGRTRLHREQGVCHANPTVLAGVLPQDETVVDW